MALRSSETRIDFHWGAILAGAFVALGSWVLLYTLGAAIDLTGAEPGRAEGFGAWTATYTLVAPILALFAGGLITGRGGRIATRASGALHGLVLWGFTSVMATFVLGTMSLLVGAVDIPAGYAWAMFASYLLSLLGAVIASALTASREERRRVEIPVRREGEVYP